MHGEFVLERFSLSNRTHFDLLPQLIQYPNPAKEIKCRIVNFFLNGLNSDDKLLNFVFNNVLWEKHSIMYKNIKIIMNECGIYNFNFFKNNFKEILNDFYYNYETDWRISLIKELLDCRSGISQCCLNYEIALLLLNVCTSSIF